MQASLALAPCVLALLRASPALAQGNGLAGELGHAVTSWDACEGSRHHDKYYLGRYAHGLAVVEVGSDSSPALARLWSKARPGGTDVTWPGGRAGVRHLEGAKLFAEATPLASAGRLYVWAGANGWGSNVSSVVGVELAKSLCDAKVLVVYVVLKLAEAGEGYAVAAVVPPEGADSALVTADPPKTVVRKLYGELLEHWQGALRADKLAPSQLSLGVWPGHFSGSALEYVASLKWSNGFDDRFSVLCLADQGGHIQRIVDQQEGGAAGAAVAVADLEGGGTQDIVYELTTIDGSSVAIWSLKGDAPASLVQTTPVGL